MDILNFISWIRGGRQVTTVSPSKTLIPVGLKDPKRDDSYLSGAISVQDLAAQIGGGIVVEGNGNAVISNTSEYLVGVPGGTAPIDFIQEIPNFSGMLMVNDHYDGGVETWICGGGSCLLLGATTASQGGGLMAMNGQGYNWANAQGLQGPFTFTVIKTRNGS